MQKQCVSGAHKNQVQSCFCYLRNVSKVKPVLKVISALMSSFQEYCSSTPFICDINAFNIEFVKGLKMSPSACLLLTRLFCNCSSCFISSRNQSVSALEGEVWNVNEHALSILHELINMSERNATLQQ